MTTIIPTYYNSEKVLSILTWPLVNAAVEEALKAVAVKTENQKENSNEAYVNQSARSRIECGAASKLLFTMPGFVGNYQLSSGAANDKQSTLACKLVTSFANNAERAAATPLPNILANILLFNSQTGELECILDGTEITAWRTAAASIVSTKYLYQRRLQATSATAQAFKLAIIGCGVQGRSHALGMCATFPISLVTLWNRTTAKAEALAAELRLRAPQTAVQVCETSAAAVANADVICVGTYSPNALVDATMLQKQNVHINTVGAGQVHFGEIAQNIYDQAQVYIDDWTTAKTELKDLKAEIIAEVGAVIKDQHLPRKQGITIFQSLGMAAEDATVAQAVYNELKIANGSTNSCVR